MMDYQKKLKAEFEKLKYVEEKLEYLNFDEHLGCYVEKNNGMPVGLAAWVNGAFYGFEQAAKAQAVPEGFVLVPEDQTKDTDRLNFLLGGEKYIRTVIHRDIQNDEYEKIGEHFQLTEVFWIDGFDYWENTSSDSERGAIDKAMIEAQEPAND